MSLLSDFDFDAFGRRWHVTLYRDVSNPRTGVTLPDVWRASAGETFVEVDYRPDEPREELEARLRARLAGPRNVELP